MIMRGHAWKLGDGITTDHIAPGRYFHLRTNLPEYAKYCLGDIRPDFVKGARRGDMIVAGQNFGLGSSREHAPILLKLNGIGAILAKSVARIFFRNAINSGLPVLIVDTDRIREGDEIELDLDLGSVRNLTHGEVMSAPSLPPVMQAIIKDGGLVEHIKKHGRLQL
jgi:3-isopropylmalate/(R)-2-methylmalate dehydratase small subunit